MSLMKHWGFILTFLLTFFVSCKENSFHQEIKEFVKNQLKTYPKSHLCDLYKSLFQDQFGPEHIIADTASAGEYIRWELKNMADNNDVLYEPTGYEGNYYRVNLKVIQDSIISYQDYFAAFLESSKGSAMPKVEDWKEEWSKIYSIVKEERHALVNFDKESQIIDSLLAKGSYAYHHSKDYFTAYHPHYRIIKKEIFESRILPKIKKAKSR